MFSNQMLTVLVALLWVSILTHETSLFLLSLAFLVAAGLSRLWERFCLTKLEYRRHLSRNRVAFGEEIELRVEIANRKLLPLSWLEIEDEIPMALPPSKGHVSPSHKPERSLLVNLCAMRPFERIRRRYTIPCTVRGEHLIGPVKLRSGDLFGFVTCERILGEVESLVVYPRVVPLGELGLPARNPLGDLRSRSWIFEDVSRSAGSREYRQGDDLRRIHWPASARSQQLQSRVYESTTSHKLALFANLDTGEYGKTSYSFDPDVLELGICTAASIARWGLGQGYQVGVYTNGGHRGSHRPSLVEPGSGNDQLEKILYSLGRLQPAALKPFDELVAIHGRQLPYGSTVVLISADLSPKMASEATTLRRHGFGVVVILTGRQSNGATMPGVVVRRVGPPEAWRDADILQAVGMA
jgi:uncharacterized protein (DUF58 family)